MDWLTLAPSNFTIGLLVGLVLGLFSKHALQLLTYAAIIIAAFELIRASGAL